MACWSARRESRASDMTASRLPISGASPKFVPRPASVGATQLCAPRASRDYPPDGALAAAFRADHRERLLLARVGSQAISEDLLQRVHGLAVVAPQLIQEIEPLPRLGRMRLIIEVERVVIEE